MKLFLPLTIVVIVILGVFLGASYLSNRSTTPKSTEAPSSSATSPVVTEEPMWRQKLTTEQKSIFSIPGPNASSEEQARYADLVKKHAVAGDTIHFAEDCEAIPLVLATKVGASVKLVNDAIVEQQVIFDEKNQFTLQPGQTTTFSIGSDKANVLLGYSCNAAPAGFLSVAP